MTTVCRPLWLLLLASCVRESVVWEEPLYSPAAASTPDLRDNDCPEAETVLGRYRYRARWRRDGALLVVMSSDSGAAWSPYVIADARPADDNACKRPAPALFADSSNRFLHIAYFAPVRGASGVYYVHSMDARQLAQRGAGMFESPIAVLYGTNPARTAVASRGDTVVVAHEDPNSSRGRIGLAVSFTAGHSFAERITVSTGQAGARQPGVSLRASEVIVTWLESGSAGTRRVQRRGTFR